MNIRPHVTIARDLKWQHMHIAFYMGVTTLEEYKHTSQRGPKHVKHAEQKRKYRK